MVGTHRRTRRHTGRDSTDADERERNRSRPTRKPKNRRAEASSATRPDPVARLHGAVGNRAVGELLESGAVQARSKRSDPDDASEREAERMADAVLGMDDPVPEPMADTAADVQRAESADVEGGAPTDGPTVDGSAEGEIRSVTGGGRPLPRAVRSHFEPRFGRSFDDVRIRTDSEAAAAAESIDARAFTYGRTIAFNSGAYRPETAGGKRLLAHELTHVLQQRSSARSAVQRMPGAAMLNGGAGGGKKAKTYPRVAKIGSTKVSVASKKEEQKARKIVKEIESNYDIDVDSKEGIKAIKNSYSNVPKAVTNKLTTMAWEYKELVALKKALDHFSPILGKQRKKSNRKGTDQEIDSVSKVKQAIDKDTKTGQLDTTTLGEFFDSSDNFSMFKAGTNSTIDFKSSKKQLEGTAVHEISHGVFEDKTKDWASRLDYWTDPHTKSGKKGAEPPVTNYGKTNASEDLSEAVMYYFVDRATLKKKCKNRFKIVEEYVDEWTK